MKIDQILKKAQDELKSIDIESAKLDAEVLLAHILKLERIDLYLDRKKILSEDEFNQFNTLLSRRKKREPVAYIIGYKEFWSLKIKLTKDVLIPRPETEGVVELALKHLKEKNELEILDLCTGSGCIAAAFAKELPDAKITATDISPGAIEIAQENLKFADERTICLIGDLFEAVYISKKFDLITANPPYISPSDFEDLPCDIRQYEPPVALKDPFDGLAISKRILKDAPAFLKDDGLMIMEMGINQAAHLKDYARQNKLYKKVEVAKDYAGIERYLILWNRS